MVGVTVAVVFVVVNVMFVSVVSVGGMTDLAKSDRLLVQYICTRQLHKLLVTRLQAVSTYNELKSPLTRKEQ